MILVIDNYDSFTFNLVQYFQELGEDVVVRRNDQITLSEISDSKPEAIVISPGPGGPEDAGISMDVIKKLGESIPILGVCLGHQAIGASFGGKVVRAPRLMHGKTSPIFAGNDGLFEGMPKPFDACRYHSLIVEKESLPDCLEVTATTDQDEIMGIRHKRLPIEGVQFHPESILTSGGKRILANFLKMAEEFRAQQASGSEEAARPSMCAEPKPAASAPAPSKSNISEGATMFREFIKKATKGENLSRSEMETAMETIMSGNATGAQIGSFLTALKMKGETVEEITGAAHIMRSKALPVRVDHDGTALIDTCGTGGDGAGTFNISTTVAFIVAGAGVMVAKHGNRSVSSSCGSADVLKQLGANLGHSPDQVGQCIEQTGFGFLFAPSFHLAMKHAIGPRQEMGIRTIFNVLGPLTNPAGASCQLLGVYDPDLTEPIASSLKGLGIKSAMVVHGLDGLDEISLCSPTKISRLKDGTVSTTTLDPKELGMSPCSLSDIAGGTAEENALHLRDILTGKPGPRRDIALLNAAAALVVSERAEDFRDGLLLAGESVDSGAALEKLNQYISFAPCC
jgi:anthranilate synthase/phosphoribosyltransferase